MSVAAFILAGLVMLSVGGIGGLLVGYHLGATDTALGAGEDA